MSVTLERGAPAPPPGSRDPRRVPVAPGGPSADELALDALAGHDAAVSFEFDPGGTPTAVLVRPTIHRGEPAAVGCRLCGAGAVPPFLHFHGLTVGRCPQCGAGQVLTIAGSDHDRADDYSARYEAERLESKALTCWELFKEKTNGLQGIRSILDVGCGEGAFLDLARAAGLRTGGIEISPQASLTAIKAGHEVLCSAVPDTPFPADRPFDAVVMWDILEHLREPGQALKDCYDALAPGGRLFVLTPMMGTIYDRLGRTVQRGSRGKVDQLLRMCWSRDHLFRFDRRGICTTLQAIGFGTVTAEPIFLLSLKADSYAGGAILPSWTGHRALDRTISVAGVSVASGLRLHNKMLIEAVRNS